MSRKRSTPRMRREALGGHAVHRHHHGDHRQRRAGDAGGADAAEHADEHDDQRWPSVRSTPNTWARNSTVTPSNSAVPFWFIDGAGGQHEAADVARQAAAPPRRPAAWSAASRSTTRWRTRSRWPARMSRKNADGLRRATTRSSTRVRAEHVQREREHHDADVRADAGQHLEAERRRSWRTAGRPRRSAPASSPPSISRIMTSLRPSIVSRSRAALRRLHRGQADAEHQREDDEAEHVAAARRPRSGWSGSS